MTRGRSIFIARQPKPRSPLVVRSRQVRVAGIARTNRVRLGPGTVRRPGVQASLGIDRRGNPPRPAITSQLAAPTRRPIVFRQPHSSSRLPIPLLGPRAKDEGENPRASNQIGTTPPGRWGDACRSRAPAPQSKPVAHASRLVTHNAPSVASGLGVRILAAGPARLPLYSHSGVCARGPQTVCSDLCAGIGGLPASRRARLPPTMTAPKSLSQSTNRVSAADSDRGVARGAFASRSECDTPDDTQSGSRCGRNARARA